MGQSAQAIEGKVVVVTGVSSGLGAAAAHAIAARGAHVIGVARDRARGDAVLAAIRARGGHADFVYGDVATLAGVAAVARAVCGLAGAIDVVIHNAGGTFDHVALTEDGVERTFALNVLGPFALTRALTPALRRARAPRIVNLATGFLDRFPLASGVGVDPLATLARPQRFSTMQQYGRSKLAAVMLSAEQATRLPGCTAVSLHPGIVMGTRFGGGQPAWVQALVGPLMRAIGLAVSADRAEDGFLAAAFGTVENGGYLVVGRAAPLPKPARDPALRARLWDFLESLATQATSTSTSTSTSTPLTPLTPRAPSDDGRVAFAQ